MKLDLTKLVRSGNVPVGFRELTAEEFPSPGDIFDASWNGKTEWLQRGLDTSVSPSPYGLKKPNGSREYYWLPHFRRIENPPGIPATHGRVTAGYCLPADLQYMLDTKTVHTLLAGGVSATNFIGCDIYRLQPAFVVENTIKRGVACYRGITIPPGFRELDQDEYRRPGTDAIWLPSCSSTQPPHIWDFNPDYSGPYNHSCNPTIRRTEPVSDKAPLLPGEKTPSSSDQTFAKIVDQLHAKQNCLAVMFPERDPFEYSGYWKRSYEAARADLARAREINDQRRERLEKQEHEIVALKTTVNRQNKQIATQSSSIGDLCKRSDDYKARCNLLDQRNQKLWVANADLQKKIGDQKYALDRLEQSNSTLCSHKHNLEVKLRDSEAIAEQRRLRIADLECSLLKIRQEVANTKVNEPAPAQPLAANPFAYREIYDNDILKDGDELSDDGIAWRTFYCGPTARVAFGDLRNHYPKLFRARRKL